jgi:hypothetical protein
MVSQAAHPTAIALISAQEERIRTPSQAAPSCATIAGRSTRPSGVVPPNQRMQPDAAARPQDRCDFGSCIRKTAIPIYWCGAADAPGVGRARANHGMSGQRPIQPRACCGLTATARESGIRAPSPATHLVPGQASTGNALGRYPRQRIRRSSWWGTESQERPSDAIPGKACDRHRVQPRCEGTHPNAIAGNAFARQHIRQVSAALRRGAAQPAHAARRRSGGEIVLIFRAIMR